MLVNISQYFGLKVKMVQFLGKKSNLMILTMALASSVSFTSIVSLLNSVWSVWPKNPMSLLLLMTLCYSCYTERNALYSIPLSHCNIIIL